MIRRAVVLVVITIFLSAALPIVAWAQHAEHYVLDAFGGVHAGGGAPVVSPGTPYFGFDVAADIVFVPVGNATATGDGILVLDRFGGVHNGGALAADPPGSGTPYFGFDAARAIIYRDIPSRVASGFSNAGLVVTTASFVTLASASIYAPDDGYLLVNGVSELHCGTGSGSAQIETSLALDGTTPPTGFDLLQRIPDCAVLDSRVIAATYLFPVSAGVHAVNLVGRMIAAPVNLIFTDRSITVLFVDKDAFGHS